MLGSRTITGTGFLSETRHYLISIPSSHEHCFLLGGLPVAKKSTWEERQAAYLSAVKEFLAKLKPEFETLPVKYVKAIRYEPKLLLSVECAKPKQ